MATNNGVIYQEHSYNTRLKDTLEAVDYNEDSNEDTESMSGSSSDSEYDVLNTKSNKKLDNYNYQKLLSSLYPSRYMSDKIDKMDILSLLKMKSKLPSTNIIICNQPKKNMGVLRFKRNREFDEDDGEEDEEDDEEDEEDDEEEDEEQSDFV